MAADDADYAVGGGEAMTPQFAIGIGCSSKASCGDVLDLIASSGAMTSDALIGTLDRCSAVGQQVADALGLRLMIFSADRLAEVTGIEHRSAFVLQQVGTHSVAEASALACLGPEARLAMPRKTGRFCTCATAVRP
jgi:cobalt-precorrin 5A hydrolase